MLSVRSRALTDVGRRRSLNEDAYACDDTLGLFVVADGVGGHAKGEVASSEASRLVADFVRQERALVATARQTPTRDVIEQARRLLESAVQHACYVVFGMAEQDPSQRGMATTLTALLLLGRQAITASVGDSRIYRVRDGAAVQLTEDHTVVNHRLKMGLITPEEAAHARGKNVITRAVGHREFVEVDTLVVDVTAGDQFVLCSDGLHGYLRTGELEQVVGAGPVDEAPERLVDLANERGGKDNITVVLVSVSEG